MALSMSDIKLLPLLQVIGGNYVFELSYQSGGASFAVAGSPGITLQVGLSSMGFGLDLWTQKFDPFLLWPQTLQCCQSCSILCDHQAAVVSGLQ